MQAMKDFVLWVINNIPTFLMAQPVCYFVGLALLLVIIGFISRIINLRRF